MIVSRLILKNWRNFRAVDVALGERMFIIGPNASGKSNLLDTFRFLRDIARQTGGGLQNAVAQRGGLSKIRCLAARQDPEVNIEIYLAENATAAPLWRYQLGIKQQVRGNRQPYIVNETVWKGAQQLLSRPTAADESDPQRLSQTYLEQINVNADFRPITGFFESFTYLHLVPQLVRHPGAFIGPGLEGDPYGRHFLDRILQTPEKTRQARLKKIVSALRLAVPQFKELTVTRDALGVPHLEAVYEHWRAQGARQQEDQFSDGTLRLIGLLWALLEGESLLLLEEPELSLNAAIIRTLPALIYRLQRPKKRQVLISTHNADLLLDKGIGGEEVLLLTPGAEGARVETAASLPDVRRLLETGMAVADAVLPHTEPETVRRLELFE